MSEKSTDHRTGINRHFQREGRIMVWAVIAIPILLVVGAFALAPYILPLLTR
jgi:hypothetical protein